jgi:O-antigen/teichoic acid export membrane protein
MLSESLVKITKGAGLAFTGSLVGLFLGFINRTLITRCGTQAEYGVYSLALTILSICIVVASLGLPSGLARSVAYARGKQDRERIVALIPAALQLALVAAISLGIIVFFSSHVVAERIFHDHSLALPLRIFAWGIPVCCVTAILASAFGGFEDIKPQVYFANTLVPLVFAPLLSLVALLRLPFTAVFYAYLASLTISCIAMLVYARRRLPVQVRFFLPLWANPVARELLLFSLPLLGLAMLGLIIVWTDTLMLGGLKSSIDVGLYNAAQPLAQFISTPLAAVGSIYLPVVSALYAQGSMSELRRNFSIITKWLCAATLPLFLVLFLFPQTVLAFVFGPAYSAAATALRILSLGFLMSNIMGPNGATLIAMGETRFVMWTYLATALLNVGLNMALIPPLGIEGAAIASASALVSINMVIAWKLYSLAKAQPFSRNLIKPALASLVLVFLFQFIFRNLVTVSWWMLPGLFILYYGIYGLAILFTRSFDREDIAMLLAIEKRVGMNLSFAKRILRRFV